MRFTIQREAFLHPLQLIAGAVEKRQTMPILGNALIQVQQSQVIMIGTDLEVELQGRVALTGDVEPGDFTVPARKLIDIVRALPENAEINFSLTDETLAVSCGRSRFKLMTLPAKDFPNIEEGVNKFEFNIPQKQLRFLIERVAFSMALQDVRYYLNGLLLVKNGAELRTVATDGHRLSMSNLSFEDFPEGDAKIIIPRKGIMELSRLLSNDDTSISVAVGDNHIHVSGEGYSFISKLIDGMFPDYHKVLPKQADKIITVERDELKQILARVSILSNEKFHGVKVLLQSGKLILETNNAEQEEAVEEMAINYQGDSLEIGFNVNYLIDVVNTLPSGPVNVAFSDNNSSAVIEEANNDSCLYVIMPMRL